MNTWVDWLLKVLNKKGLILFSWKYILGVSSHGVSPTWKRNSPYWKKTHLPPPLKNEVPFQETIAREKIQMLYFINICISLVKQHRKKLAVILQKHHLSLGACKISKNPRTVRKYITWFMANKLTSIHVLDVGFFW